MSPVSVFLPKSHPLAHFGRALAVAAAYFAAGKLALLLAIPPGYATAVWPAAGIALVGILLYGSRVSPGIWLGSFLTNIWTSFDPGHLVHSLSVAGVIGAGAAAQALAGAWLIRRFVGFPTPLLVERDVVRFLVLGGPVACLVNATCGVVTLTAAGINPIDAAAFSWFTWWVGDTIGVLITAPLVLMWLAEPAEVWRPRRLSVGLPLGFTFAVTVAIFLYASHWEHERARGDFERQAESLSRGIEQNIASYVTVLRSVAGFYAGSHAVERDEFRAFVTGLVTHYPGIQAVSWDQRVSDAEREAFERSVRGEGFPQFRITEQNERWETVPAARRIEYVPVTYIEPYAGNEKALGYDTASRSDRRAVQQNARDSGEFAVTGRLRLVQDSDDRAGVVAFVPVFRNGMPHETIDQRRTNLRGFIAGVFRIEDVMKTALRGADLDGIALRLVDDSAPADESLLWGAQPSRDEDGFAFRDSLEVAGLRWTVHAVRDSRYLVAHRSLNSWMVLLGGLLLDSLLGSFLLMLTGRTARIEALVSERSRQLSRAKEGLEEELRDRERAERALRASENQFRSVTESANDAIILADADGRIIRWNRAAHRCFGYEEREALGQPVALLIPERYRDAYQQGLARVGAGGAPRLIGRLVELSGLRKDGTEFPVEISLSSWSTAEGTFYSGVLRDVTDRRRSAVELELAVEAAEAANQAKSAFLANMSHEIRTPMNAVIGMAGLLHDTPLDDQQRDFVETIRTSGDYLLTVINEILDFSKIEAGYLELEVNRFDVRHCVAEAAELIAANAGEKDVEITYEIGDEVPQMLSSDAGRLRQVLVNLIGNGVKFTERGDVAIRVEARQVSRSEPKASEDHRAVSRSEPKASEDHRAVSRWELHFAVRDSGIGIAGERFEHLFEPFTQADSSVTRRFGGTGLGLTISKRLCELLGGRIWVESEVGRGSTFHFTIVADAEPSPAGSPVAARGLDGLRVLIVDDNATNRRILRLQTQSWGMQPRETESPREALSWIARGDPFDVAILDYQMPEVDGISLAREIRRASVAHPPLVLLSSSGVRITVDTSEAGIAAVLQKPVRSSTLYDTLAHLLGGGSARAFEAFEPRPAVAGASKQRILIAEDNAINQKVARLLLQKLGYTDLVTVGNGLEVIEVLERGRYDVLLMDIQMPEMDGLEASRTICARWPREDRPAIIAMTAHALAGDRERCLEAGMDGYLAKPIQSAALSAELRRVRGPAPAGAPPPPLRLSQLLSDVGDVETLSGIVDDFASEARAASGALRDAFANGDARSARRIAHTLASTAAMVGAGELSALAREIERLAAAGDSEAALARSGALEVAVSDAVRAVTTERDGLCAKRSEPK